MQTLNYSKQTNEHFLNLYRQLEEIRANKPETYSFYKNKFYQKLNDYREIRNYLTHEQYGGDYPVAVSSKVCFDFESILKRMKETSFSRSNKDIKFLYENDEIEKAISLFIENGYTYLPLVDERKRLKGIVSNMSLIKIMANKGISYKDKLSAHLEFFKLEDDPKRFLFVSKYEPLSTSEKEFSLIKESKRLGLVFISENGKMDESILGILSIYDITSLS